MPPKERVVYVALASVFVFGAGFVGAQRMRQPAKIVFDIPKPAASDQLASAPSVASAPSIAVASEVVVHVVGAVKKPGVVHLPAGSRIDDAVKAAGGARVEANLEAINLASKLQDGQQVVVPKLGQVAVAASGDKDGKHLVDLSKASYMDLDAVPGIGETLAEKLIEYRLKHGHLTLDDLRAIPGVGQKKIDKIRPYVKG